MGKDTICQVLNQCLRNFNTLTESEALARYESEVSRRRWLDELGRLRVWSGNIGAHQSGQSSLDYRLRDASHLKRETIKLLNRMLHVLQNAVEVVNEDGEEGLEVEIEDDDETDDMTEVQQLYQSIVEIVNCLFQISMAVRRPADHDRLLNTKIKNESFFEPWARQHISHKYPDAEDAVVSRLSVAMSRQKAILKYRERHRAKLGNGLYEYVETNSTKLSETVATEMAADNDQLHFLETASNSGLSQTSYASSLLATQATASIPNPPKASRNRSPFECPYCFHIITIKHKKDWARHIFRDLMPYVCLSSNCATPSRLYDSRHQWFIHMCEAHAQSQDDFVCPLCRGEFQSSSFFEKHVGRHLEELALFVLPRNDIDEESNSEIASSDSSMDTAGSDRNSKAPIFSYWSISEMDKFPLLLAEFGRDFIGISRIMKTKSPQMVRNYYQRQIMSGRKDFEEIVAVAESEKARGELLTALEMQNSTPRGLNEEPSSPTRSVSAESPESNVDEPQRDANQFWVDEHPGIVSDESSSTNSTSTNSRPTAGFSSGPFICTYPGCTAPPFATQYLMNSHANVHSQDRPHFCPVEGCPRGPGGKGFKQKNELIRHGVVHNSPGYVCPFCPDSRHRYPRPDSLRLHVMSRHPGKPKNDPALEQVFRQLLPANTTLEHKGSPKQGKDSNSPLTESERQFELPFPSIIRYWTTEEITAGLNLGTQNTHQSQEKAIDETGNGHGDDAAASTRTNTKDRHATDDKSMYTYTNPREQFELDARAQLRLPQDKEREKSETRDIQTHNRLRELEHLSLVEPSDPAHDSYHSAHRSHDPFDPDPPHIRSTNKTNLFDTSSRSDNLRQSINEHFIGTPPETSPGNPIADMAPSNNVSKKEVPPGARWTKIDRRLVNAAALESGGERFEVRSEYFIVLRILTEDEIRAYAIETQKIRAARNRNNRRGQRNGKHRSDAGNDAYSDDSDAAMDLN